MVQNNVLTNEIAYYGFPAREPLPFSFDETEQSEEHSEYCPTLINKSIRYEFMKTGFSYNGMTYYITRKNRII